MTNRRLEVRTSNVMRLIVSLMVAAASFTLIGVRQACAEEKTEDPQASNYWDDFKVWDILRKGTSSLGKNEEIEDKLLQSLTRNVYLVKFKPVNGANPKTAKEFIDIFYKSSSLYSSKNSLRLGFFRTTKMDGYLVGSFLTDELERMKADITKNPSLELLSVEKVTPEMFVAYHGTVQESLESTPGKNKSAQEAGSQQVGNSWIFDCNIWHALRIIGKDKEKEEKLLQRLINNLYVVKFKPVNGANPKNAQEFISVYHKSSSLRSGGINIGYGGFGSKNMGDYLLGSFLTDEPEQMKADIKKNPSLELLSAEKVTPEMFVEYVSLPQEKLEVTTPAPSKWQKNWGIWSNLSKTWKWDKEDLDELLRKLLENVYLVKFKPTNDTNPKTPQEFLSKFSESPSKPEVDGLMGRTGFFRTKIVDGYLVGSFLTEAPEEMKTHIKNHPSLELLSVEKVTPEMFHEYDATRQESLGANPNAPRIVLMEPANGAKDVDPNITELRVTFDQPMAGSYAWCTNGKDFPETRKGTHWTKDRLTCVLHVELKPESHYQLILNGGNNTGFQTQSGIPLESVFYSFSTK